jgi:hypothetical protein
MTISASRTEDIRQYKVRPGFRPLRPERRTFDTTIPIAPQFPPRDNTNRAPVSAPGFRPVPVSVPREERMVVAGPSSIARDLIRSVS